MKLRFVLSTLLFALLSLFTAHAASSPFSSNLTLGSSGIQVLELQQILNRNPATEVTSSGPGSPGHETSYFGLLTRAAVLRFQTKYASQVLYPAGLTKATGFVGAYTRQLLNTLASTATQNTTTSTTVTCGPGALFNTVTGQPCTSAVSAPSATSVIGGGSSASVGYVSSGGSSGGTVIPTPSPLTGACGSANGTTVSSAPSAALCNAGSASTVSGSGPWLWTCAGSNGGSSVTCEANKATASVSASSASVSVPFTGNRYGIVSTGTAPANGGADGSSYAYASALLGNSLVWNGITFPFGPAGTMNAIANATVPLPSGNYTSLNLLGAGVQGNQPNQTLTVTYTDGSTSTFTQGFSDWCRGSVYTGESTALTTPYRITPSGATQALTCAVYGYSFPLNSAKTVQSLTLPANNAVVVLSINLGSGSSANASGPVAVNGSCGSANGTTLSSTPSANLCASGSASSINGSGPWSWSCTGSNGGTNVSCSAGVAAAQISSTGGAPAPAAAVGYTTETFNSTKLGNTTGTWQVANFYSKNSNPFTNTQNADGSLTMTGGGYAGGDLSTAVQTHGAPHSWTGLAFGGGAYFEATMSFTGQSNLNFPNGGPAFWALDVEHTSQGYGDAACWPSSPQLMNSDGKGCYDDFTEVDFMEYDFPGGYQFGIGNWYNEPTKSTSNPTNEYGHNVVGSLLVPAGTDFSQPHRYGTLWVPATGSGQTTYTQGYLQNYFDGVPLGPKFTWDYHDPSAPGYPAPPPVNGSTAMSIMDWRHLFLMLGSDTYQPTTVYSVTVWQKSAANNITE